MVRFHRCKMVLLFVCLFVVVLLFLFVCINSKWCEFHSSCFEMRHYNMNQSILYHIVVDCKYIYIYIYVYVYIYVYIFIYQYTLYSPDAVDFWNQ
jgi:hypothetical protein